MRPSPKPMLVACGFFVSVRLVGFESVKRRRLLGEFVCLPRRLVACWYNSARPEITTKQMAFLKEDSLRLFISQRLAPTVHR